jgi:RND superfamily putative drug exporter
MLVLLGLFIGGKLDSHLTTSLRIPHSSSAAADDLLAKNFNENIEGTFTVIYPFKNASNSAIKIFQSKIDIASQSIPTSSIVVSRAFGGTLFVNINTSLSLIQASKYTSILRSALMENGLKGALVTGPPAIKSDVTPVLARDLHRGEIIAVIFALAVLLLLFGFSSQILIPFLSALGSISATIIAIFLIAQKFLVVLYIPNIVELIGLGLAIDYSLLMLFRFRKEYARSPDQRDDALVRTMASAGRTVALSALTVSIALGTLTLVPVPFIRSLGFASALVPLISLMAAFTLQPSLLSLFNPGKRAIRAPHRFFNTLGVAIVRRPLVVMASSLLVLLALTLPVLSLHLTPSSLTALPPQLESQRALSLITSSAGSGVITPNELLIDLGRPSTAGSSEVVVARQTLSAHLLKNPEVLLVANGAKAPFVDRSGRYLRLFIFARHGFGTPQGQHLVTELRLLAPTAFSFPKLESSFITAAPARRGRR